MKRLVALLGSGVLFVLLGCGEAVEDTAARGRPVSLTPVEAVDLEDSIEATGELVAKEQTVVAAEVAGRISDIVIDEGQAAASGEAVLTIDPERRSLERDRAQAQVEDARAALRDREREYQRVVELHERNVASETQLEQAKTELDRAGSKLLAAQADLGVAVRALADARVKAPFSGLVSRRLVGRGQYVSPGTPLFELVALDPIEVQFHLPEVDSARVKMGHVVGVRVSPYPGEVFKARVVVISPVIDSRTRTLRVKAEFDNSDGRLRPGLFARVDLGISTRRGVAMIPEEAVLQRADGAVVFRLVEDSRVERLVIEVGSHQNGTVEVVRGLDVGDLVVSRGQSALADGERVLVRNPDGSLVEVEVPAVAVRDD